MTSDEVEVVVAALDAGCDALRAFQPLLAGDERQRAERFAFERDRRRFIVARARLRQLLGERLGVEPESVELTCGPYGKPSLAPRPGEPDLRFNLSHCGDVAAYAFTAGREVGIDIEAVRALPDADALAERFFSRRENEAYRALDERERPLGFFNCWTRKEAFVKAIGDGLHHRLDSFDVSLAPAQPARILHVGATEGRDCGWALRSFSPAPGLVGAIVHACSGRTNECTARVLRFRCVG
jgi:4'-phosphopantetheinyl transferase